MKTAGTRNPLIEAHYDDLVRLCREFGVARLEIFGSATTEEFDSARSDLDFLIEYPDDYDFGPWLRNFVQFKSEVEELFGRRVDLVMLKAVRNPYVRRSIEASRQLLYAA